MRHGDAVAVGIAAVARLSADRGWLKPADRDAIIDGLRRVGLPTHAHASLLAEALPHLGKDKKSDAKFVDLIAIRRPGEVFIERLVLEEIADDLTRSGGES